MFLTGRRETAGRALAGGNKNTFIKVYCISGLNCFCFCGDFFRIHFSEMASLSKETGKLKKVLADQELPGNIPRLHHFQQLVMRVVCRLRP